jgi:hypothetical protein
MVKITGTHLGGSDEFMPAEDQAEANFERVTFAVTRARPINSKSIFALVDVEMRIADISFWVLV